MAQIPPSPRLFMFDIEGTLVDCVPQTLACWRQTFRQFGFEISMRELQRHSGQDPDDMIKALLPRRDAERLSPILQREQGTRYREECLPSVQPFPAVRAVFETICRAGHATALVTSCARDELNRYMELMGIADLVGAIACGEDVDRAKPHPELIRLGLRRAHRGPAEAVMIGDTPFDAAAAAGAWVLPIGVLCGGFTQAELLNAGCRAVYSDPAQLQRKLLAGLAPTILVPPPAKAV